MWFARSVNCPAAAASAKVIGLALAVAGTVGCTVHRDAPDLAGQDVRVTLLHTSDIHSRMFPYEQVPTRFDEGYGLTAANSPFGGAARIATVVREEREAAGRLLWLDSGDSFQGAPAFNLFHGEVEARALSLAGLDAAVLGNHEFDLGSDNLFDQIDNFATFRPLAANYAFEIPDNPDQESLRDVVEPYAYFDLDGVAVCVVGLANWSSMTGIFEGGNSLGIRPIDEAQVVNNYVRMLRPSCDLMVMLSHLGLDEDEGLGAEEIEQDFNELLPLGGVDVIMGGHLHIVLNPPKVLESDEYGNKTVLVHSGAFAKYVGRLDLVVRIGDDNADPVNRSKVTAFSYGNIPIDSRVPNDRAMTEMLEPYYFRLNQRFDLEGVFGYVNTVGGGKIVRNDVSGGDSQLGNMVARSMQIRSGVEAEFALTNSLGIRADFEPGALDIEQMFNVFPFENSITVMYLSGSEVKEMLDFVTSRSAARGCRTQAQVAGIWFDMVCRSETCGVDNQGRPRTSCAKNIYLGEECRNGNSDGPIDPSRCAPLVDSALYRVAVNDYIARGGSGFDVLERNPFKQDTGLSLRDVLIDYLRRQPICEPSLVLPGESSTVLEQYGQIACMDNLLEPHDGRIRPVFE